jgi:glutathione peroxidase
VSNISYGTSIKTSAGDFTTLEEYKDKVLLIVNVASNCGFTPQYAALQNLQDEYGDRGLQVLGFPCNQFGAQAGGSNEAIVEFCSMNYGVNFLVFAKIKVNGKHRHELYSALTEATDAVGKAGKVKWNFEKFLVAPGGTIVGRYRSKVEPDSAAIIPQIEKLLPATATLVA